MIQDDQAVRQAEPAVRVTWAVPQGSVQQWTQFRACSIVHASGTLHDFGFLGHVPTSTTILQNATATEQPNSE